MVDRPQGAIYGGSVAAPAFQKIVGWAVPYLGIAPNRLTCRTSPPRPEADTAHALTAPTGG